MYEPAQRGVFETSLICLIVNNAHQSNKQDGFINIPSDVGIIISVARWVQHAFVRSLSA